MAIEWQQESFLTGRGMMPKRIRRFALLPSTAKPEEHGRSRPGLAGVFTAESASDSSSASSLEKEVARDVTPWPQPALA